MTSYELYEEPEFDNENESETEIESDNPTRIPVVEKACASDGINEALESYSSAEMLIDNYVKSQRDKMKNNNSTNYQNNYQTNNGYDGTLQNSQENYAEPILLSNDTQYSELETNSKLAETDKNRQSKNSKDAISSKRRRRV